MTAARTATAREIPIEIVSLIFAIAVVLFLQSRSANSSNRPVAPDSSITEDEKEQGTRSERDARKVRLDDIDEMRREADAYTVQAAELRQIADAAQPLYDTLDDHQRRRLVQFVREDLRANLMDDRHDRGH
jgi:hypothetical protein